MYESAVFWIGGDELIVSWSQYLGLQPSKPHLLYEDFWDMSQLTHTSGSVCLSKGPYLNEQTDPCYHQRIGESRHPNNSSYHCKHSWTMPFSHPQKKPFFLIMVLFKQLLTIRTIKICFPESFESNLTFVG